MNKQKQYLNHVDPEYQRWGRTYSSFPGVAECLRLIRTRKAAGAWADIVVYELAENAPPHLAELTEAFRTATSDLDPSDGVAISVLQALEIAQLPESVPFFTQVLQEKNARFTPYAQRALAAINTQEARTALLHISQAGFKFSPPPRPSSK